VVGQLTQHAQSKNIHEVILLIWVRQSSWTEVLVGGQAVVVTRYRVDLALLAVAVVWGSSYLAAKEVVDTDGVFGFLAVRFAMAVGVLALLLGRRITRIGRAELAAGIPFGAILAAICVCETYGVTMTSASNAGLLMALTVVLTPLLARGSVAPMFYLPAVVVVLGCVALTQAGGFAWPGAGDALIAGAAALRAVHVTVMSRMSIGRQLDSAAVTLVQLSTVAALTALPACCLGQFGAVLQMSASEWVLTGYLAVACTVFAFVVQMWAVGRSTPSRVSLLLGTEPLWAVLIGVGLAGDPISTLGVLGAVLVLGGTNWGRVVDNATFPNAAPTARTRRGSRAVRAAEP
jgi:drug/metabolite transporter (DMT)-like permease